VLDTKKKELIGNFMRNGKTWCKEAVEVHAHDFPSLAICRAVPYGIYDVTKNAGYVFVGTSADTPEFAVDALVRWWKAYGCIAYPGAAQLLIPLMAEVATGIARDPGNTNFRKKSAPN
jgi:hypothetical protein